MTGSGRQSSLYGSYNKLWTLVVPLRVLQHAVDVSCPSPRLQNDVDVSRSSTRLIVAFYGLRISIRRYGESLGSYD